MPRAGYTNRHNLEQQAARRDCLAEMVADGLTIKAAASAMGIPPTTANSIFASIRRRLGWQAQ